MGMQFEYRPPAINAIAVLHAAKEVAENAGAHIILEASLPLVPVDTGELKASGTVTRDGPGAAVVYDVTAPDGYPYGVKQHEDMTLNHPNGGQAKFLEQPMHSAAPAVHAEMAAVLRRAFGL